MFVSCLQQGTEANIDQSTLLKFVCVAPNYRKFGYKTKFIAADISHRTLSNKMTKHQHLDELAKELFQVFSRTEYALKATGFNNGDGPAEANWRNFALTVEDLIANPTELELKDAIAFLFNAPPKKQMIKGGLIKWEKSKPHTDSRADELLIYVRRVRNNLFHGGKFNGHWFSPGRSEPLLRYSIVILNACVNRTPLVYEAYHG